MINPAQAADIRIRSGDGIHRVAVADRAIIPSAQAADFIVAANRTRYKTIADRTFTHPAQAADAEPAGYGNIVDLQIPYLPAVSYRAEKTHRPAAGLVDHKPGDDKSPAIQDSGKFRNHRR